MPLVEIRDMDTTDEYFVGTCTHTGESDEIDATARRRLTWLRDMYERGLRAKVAVSEGNRVGFLYVMPIEICPWGPLGRGLSAVPCLFVKEEAQHLGTGQALIAEAERETLRQDRKGVVITAYYHDFWFMPASFFERCGFSVVERKGETAILWKVFDDSAEPPGLLERNYQFSPVAGKVVVDLFWNSFCATSNTEAQRVREVAAEFGNAVVLNEYSADDRETLTYYQTPRGVFVNGKEVWWGYEAPREGIRKAISQAVSNG